MIHYKSGYCGQKSDQTTAFWFEVTCPLCTKKRIGSYKKLKKPIDTVKTIV